MPGINGDQMDAVKIFMIVCYAGLALMFLLFAFVIIGFIRIELEEREAKNEFPVEIWSSEKDNRWD